MPGLLQKKPLLFENLPWLQKIRNEGRESFAAQGVPGAKTEAWKYTKPRALTADDFVMNVPAQVAPPPSELPFPAYRLCFENGVFDPSASSLPQGVEVLPLIEAVMNETARPYLNRLGRNEDHPFLALNNAYLNEGIFIRIAKNVTLKKPLLLLNRTAAAGQNLFYNLRNLIVLEEGAAADFIECYGYDGAAKSSYFGNFVNEIFLAPSSRLHHYKFQNEAFKAHHIALSLVQAESAAVYHNFCLQKGADIGRNEVRVKLCGENAAAEVNAAYLMSGWATLDTTTDIEHLAPCTFSEQLVKGVVNGDAKGVFQGRIHIAPHAVKTEGRQLHKALLLSDAAEIDVKPELEIFADDVKCSHGAASGELDEEQLFYMCQRGIGREEAKQMLVDAYLDDVISKIPDAPIRDWFKSLVQ